MRTWERSCVLRLSIEGGTLYFKALPPMFAHEIPLTAWLAARYPANLPRLLAVDRDRRWMLMAEMAGEPLDCVADVTRWEAALRAASPRPRSIRRLTRRRCSR